MTNLKKSALRGGAAKIASQIITTALRVGALMALARLLEPTDFGLLGMSTAVVGALSIFKDFGLSTATVQRSEVTEGQMSTLFWLNILVGTLLAFGCVAAAPVVSKFFHEPRLLAITAVLGTSFLFNAAGVQHSALLQRQMRFTALATADTCALAAASSLGIVLAVQGFGYWALVVTTAATPLFNSLGLWGLSGWRPSKPGRSAEVNSMLSFGTTLTLNGLVVYIAYNIEKVMMGRMWGAQAVGIYGRAYQLVTMPTDNLNAAVGGVTLAALSRLQQEPVRLKRYFLKGYAMLLALSVPATIGAALFGTDLLLLVLGPKWTESAPIFRRLAPTVFVFACINPMHWLLVSLGLVKRSLHMALVICPLVISAYVIGFPYGPSGLATSYSAAMILWLLPHLAWSVRGTAISFREILAVIAKPLFAGLAACALVLIFQPLYSSWMSPLSRVITGSVLLALSYSSVLIFGLGQKVLLLETLAAMKSQHVASGRSIA